MISQIVLLIIAGLLISGIVFTSLRFIKEQRTLQLLQRKNQILEKKIIDLEDRLRIELHDNLTGLLGRQLFEDRLQQSLTESARYKFNLAILRVEINEFNMIYTGMGHESGDSILIEIAQRLDASIRKVDSITRASRDTFLLLLVQITRPETAAIVAERILQAFSIPFQIVDKEIYINLNIGIAVYPADGEEKEILLQRAKEALQASKDNGKKYQFYLNTERSNNERELAFYIDLKKDNVSDQFKLQYQPIMDIENNVVVFQEIKLQWQHPQLGLIEQEELFYYADKQNKINDFCEWSLRHACQENKKNQVIIMLQLSANQLENSQFVYRLTRIMQEESFATNRLLLAINRTHLALDFNKLEKSFNQLHYLGIKLALDNFGSNAFNLKDLKLIPVQYLRLGGDFINDIENNEKTLTLTECVLQLAKSLSIDLLIQNVENEMQLTILKQLGCCFIQGAVLTQQQLDLSRSKPHETIS